MLWFALGLFVGSIIGTFTMALCAAARNRDYHGGQ